MYVIISPVYTSINNAADHVDFCMHSDIWSRSGKLQLNILFSELAIISPKHVNYIQTSTYCKSIPILLFKRPIDGSTNSIIVLYVHGEQNKNRIHDKFVFGSSLDRIFSLVQNHCGLFHNFVYKWYYNRSTCSRSNILQCLLLPNDI